jgi:glucose-1-phosphate thymidylyltransferase
MAKGIILAGGIATRLFPVTEAVSKQALPVYDKPMIYYPLTTLMQAGVRDIMVITNPENQQLFRKILRDADRWGVSITVTQQDNPKGIAQAITIAADHAFIDGRFFLILGDNLFHGACLVDQLVQAATMQAGAGVFLACVRDPQRYGVAEFVNGGPRLAKIVEKPVLPPSPWAVTGLYAYDEDAPDLVRDMQPSQRGELEITDLNNLYLRRGQLSAFKLAKEVAWLDTGTPEALLEAAQYVQAIQHRSMTLVGSPDLVAVSRGWMTAGEVERHLHGRDDSYAKQVRAILN